MAAADAKSWINLERASVLVLDGNSQGSAILRQLLAGFGVRNAIQCATAAEAQAVCRDTELDLIVSNDSLTDMSGYDFVHWLRRAGIDPNSFTPVISIGGHTRRSDVSKARDCGANFVIAKPISARVLLERIIWVAREKRPFVDAGSYLGPDRRFHDMGVPEAGGRRRGDAALEAVAKAEETAGQDVDEGDTILPQATRMAS